MDESRLKGQTLYPCLVDFKKAFDTLPHDGLWERMRKLGVPPKLRTGVYRIYERVLCHLKHAISLSHVYQSNTGVKHGCPLSPTLFRLCIDRLEEMIDEQASKEGFHGPQIRLFAILLLLYADDVLLLAYDPSSMHKLLQILQDFYKESGLQVNVRKTKTMAIQYQITHSSSRRRRMARYTGPC